MSDFYIEKKGDGYVAREDNGCCNLVIWDFLITVVIIAFSCQSWFSLTGFQSFCIGLLGGILFMGLMCIRLLRKILVILFSFFWSGITYELLDYFFKIDDYSLVWRWGIGIFIFILAVGIHMISTDKLNLSDS